jgi:hypothetical protein
MLSPKERFGITSVGKTQPQADVEQPLPAGCRTLHSTEARGVISMVAGAHRPQARGLSFAAWIAAEPGCKRTRTVPDSSGPGYWPFVRVLSVSNHSSMRWFFARLSTARRPTRVDLNDRVGDGPDLALSLHFLNRKAMTFFQPVSSRQAPLNPLPWIARKRMRPNFLCACLNEHRLKGRLRTSRSILVRPGATLSGRRLAAPRTRLRLPRPCCTDRTRRSSRTRAACQDTHRPDELPSDQIGPARIGLID